MTKSHTSPSLGRSDRKHLGWITLAGFVLTYIVTWIGDAIWGLAVTQIGRLLDLSPTLISTLSISGMVIIQCVLWTLAIRWVLRRSLLHVAFPFRRWWWADLLLGTLITFTAIAAVFLLAENAGWLVFHDWAWNSTTMEELFSRIWVSLLLNLSVALLEELSGRAYLLNGLKEAWGKWAGLAIMSLVFGLYHLVSYSQAGYPLYTLLFPAIAGVLFGWFYYQTGSLWLPIGIHFAFDLFESDVFNLSGLSNPRLFGALTDLQGPFDMPAIVNALWLDMLVLLLIFLLVRCWLRFRSSKGNLSRP